MLSGDNSIARGKGGAFAHLLQQFSHYWQRIDILTPTAPDAKPTVLFDRVFVHPAPYHRLLQPLFIRQKGRELMSQRPYGLVVSHDFGFFYNGLGAWWLLQGNDMPLVSEIHHIEGYPIATTLREKLWRGMARWYLPQASKRVVAFRVVNQREVPQFLKSVGVPEHQILVLSSLYLEQSIYQPRPETEKRYDLLFVGRLSANKGVFTLLEAFKRVLETHPQARLGLRGEGELLGRVQATIAEAKMSAQIDWIPRQSTPEGMASVYHASRMLVCASSVEGNPRVTVEAMACGVPVLSTPVGVMPDVIGDNENGLLFPYGDSEALASHIRTLLDNPEQRQYLAERGRNAVKGFNAQDTIRAYAEAYQRLAKNGGTP